MTNRMSPSVWGVAYCCFAVIMVTAFVRVGSGLDPSMLAMH
jgi:hypothetical protein